MFHRVRISNTYTSTKAQPTFSNSQQDIASSMSSETTCSATATAPYRELNPEKREIRILTLHAGSEAEDLIGSLQIVPLDDNPNFIALSYVWGSDLDVATIMVDGCPLRIGRNLDDFLRALRHDEPMAIWTDAICINQGDLIEKGFQIPLMGEVYSRCHGCIAWMGKSTPYTEDAISAYKDIRADKHWHETVLFTRVEDDEIARASREGNMPPDWIGFEPDGRDFPVYARLVPNAPAITAEWLENPYWSRVWTLQELCLPMALTFLWSRHSHLMERVIKGSKMKFEGVAPGISSHGDCCSLPSMNLGTAANRVSMMKVRALHIFALKLFSTKLSVWSIVSGMPRAKLGFTSFDILAETSQRQCYDRRDLIYGTLGILKIADLEVDYTASLADVFIDAAIRLIDKEAERLPGLVHACSRSSNIADVPSWVPDWSGDSNNFKKGSNTRDFMASGDLVAEMTVNSRKSLTVRGYRLGTISSMWTDRGTTVILNKETLMALEDFAGIGDAEAAHTGLKEAFWRVLINRADVDKVSATRLPSVYQDFERLRRETLAETAMPDLPRQLQLIKTDIEVCLYWTLLKTDFGCLGSAHTRCQRSDELWIFLGGSMPFVVRPLPDNIERTGVGRLLSEAYLDGFMYGEAIEKAKNAGVAAQECVLV